MVPTQLAERLRARFPDAFEARGDVTFAVEPGDLLGTLGYLRDDPDLKFGFLSDLTATDWPNLEPRFWLAYHLLSMEHAHRVRVKVPIHGSDPHVPSVAPMFPTANWLEREAFDLFGVVFEGHPELRRILMPEDWEGFPLRKDEPMGGVNTRYKGAFIPPPDQRGL